MKIDSCFRLLLTVLYQSINRSIN